jgi:membrane-associated phospholipid phosphatase
MARRAPISTPPPETPVPPLEAVAPERRPWWSLRHRGRTAWIVHLVLLAVFAVLAAIAHSLRSDRLDVWVTDQLQRPHLIDAPLQLVSWIGYAPQEIVILGVLSLIVFAVGYRTEAIFLVVSAIGANIVGEIVKDVVARPRPSAPLVQVLRHVSGYSFPSGHVLTFVSFFGFLAYLAYVEPSNPWVSRLVLAVCIVLLVLVGPSRIYLGAHWTSDVIGAYLLGGIWLSVILRTYVAWLEHHKPGPRQSSGRTVSVL